MNKIDNYKRKFFDETEQTVVVTRRLYLKKSAEEVLECLKSEGVIIKDIDSIFKTLDIILRAIGFHHEADDADQIMCINSLIGVVRLKNVFTTDNNIEQLRTILDAFQDNVKSGWKYEDNELERIKDNAEIVAKELITYFNDIVDVMINEFNPHEHMYINAIFTSKDSDEAFFNMMLSYNPIMRDYGINIMSTMVSDEGIKDNDVIFIGSTLNRSTVETTKANLEIKDGENEEENSDDTKSNI